MVSLFRLGSDYLEILETGTGGGWEYAPGAPEINRRGDSSDARAAFTGIRFFGEGAYPTPSTLHASEIFAARMRSFRVIPPLAWV